MIARYLRKVWLVLLFATGILVADQWTKDLIRDYLDLYEQVMPLAWLGEIFFLEHVPNHGAAFGILQNGGQIFTITAVVVSIAILISVHYLQPSQRLMQILLGMALGGALGNFIDRVTQGYVTDFLKFGIPDRAYWPNFNVADASIVVSVILLTILAWREDAKSTPDTAEQPASPPASPVIPDSPNNKSQASG